MISKTLFTLAAIAVMASAQDPPATSPTTIIGEDERGAGGFPRPTTTAPAPTAPAPTPAQCLDCGCFTCKSATNNNDGTVSVRITHCKTDTISWMCCVGVDGGSGNCAVTAPCTDAKCNGIAQGDMGGLVIKIPSNSKTFEINTHDGKLGGTGDMVNAVCGGNGNQGQGCGGAYSAHCLIEFDLEADCGFAPVCATDTKTCADGSTVSRALPDCEFADCPTPDSGEPDPTDKAFTKGDPHFKTFGNEMFDYHGQCDLVLLQNPLFENMGMDIHVRTKITDWWSSVEAAAVKFGSEILEVNAGDKDEWLFINGKPNEAMEENKFYHSTVAGFEVRYRRSGIVREAYVYLDGRKERLAFKSFKDFLRVDVDWLANPAHYKGALGLLGSMDLNGNRVGRDGVTHIPNHNKFGQEWQVREDEPKLFHSYEGAVQAPNKCILPDFSPEKMAQKARRLAESNITPEQIEKACGHLPADERKGCEYDVIATQDLDMASVW